MRRGRVEIVIELFDVFAMIALVAGNTEHAFLQDWVLFIPKRQGKAQPLMIIRDTSYAVFTPSIGTRARMLMGKVRPSVSIIRVVLANGRLEERAGE